MASAHLLDYSRTELVAVDTALALLYASHHPDELATFVGRTDTACSIEACAERLQALSRHHVGNVSAKTTWGSDTMGLGAGYALRQRRLVSQGTGHLETVSAAYTPAYLAPRHWQPPRLELTTDMIDPTYPGPEYVVTFLTTVTAESKQHLRDLIEQQVPWLIKRTPQVRAMRGCRRPSIAHLSLSTCRCSCSG